MSLESSPDFHSATSISFPKFGIILLLSALAWISTGCAGVSSSTSRQSSSSNGSSVKINLSPSTTTVSSGATQQFVATLTSTSNTAVSWSASAGTITNSGLFTAPSVASPTKVVITATNAVDQNAAASLRSTVVDSPSGQGSLPNYSYGSASAIAEVTVVPLSKLTISNQSLAGGTSGVPYSASLTATGGSAPYQWQISQGALPPGLSLDKNSGAISGITSQTGTFSFTTSVTLSLIHISEPTRPY